MKTNRKTLLLLVLCSLLSGHCSGPSGIGSSIVFEGREFQHVEMMRGGILVNHFYTPSGTEMAAAEEFIQIIEFEQKVDKSEWSRNFGPLLNRYQLKPLAENSLQMFGTFKRQGVGLASYATPVTIKGQDYYVMYMQTLGEGSSTPKPSDARDRIQALEAIGEKS